MKVNVEQVRASRHSLGSAVQMERDKGASIIAIVPEKMVLDRHIVSVEEYLIILEWPARA